MPNIDLVGPPKKLRMVILLYADITTIDVVNPMVVFSYFEHRQDCCVGEIPHSKNEHGNLEYSYVIPLESVSSGDVLISSCGPGDIDVLFIRQVLYWIKQVDSSSQFTTSATTYFLILSESQLLFGPNACALWAYVPELKLCSTNYQSKRFIQDGKFVFATGESARINMAFFLLEILISKERARGIRFRLDNFTKNLGLITSHTILKFLVTLFAKKVRRNVDNFRQKLRFL